MLVHPVPAFNDNYLWLIEHQSGNAVVVDPGDAKPITNELKKRNLKLSAILVTHHHRDHIGGISALLSEWNCPVYGPDSVKIPSVTHSLKEGDTLNLLSGDLRLKVIEVPGHTLEHIVYTGEMLTGDSSQSVLFCGDTLFAGGCGRVFEGTYEQMQDSLDKLSSLPANTEIYCAHEYTLSNLAFAEAVEPNNADIQQRIAEEKEKREKHLPTLPSTISKEIKTNPFLRFRENKVISATNSHWSESWVEDKDIFGGLRQWKDNF